MQKRQQLQQQAGKMDKRRKTQHTDPQRVVASENLPSTKPTSELKRTEIKLQKLDDWTDQKRKGKETTQLYSWSEGHTVQTAAAATGDGKRDTSCSLSHTFINQSQCTWGDKETGNHECERKCPVVYLFIKKPGLLVWELDLHVQISWCFDSTPCACTHTAPAGA